MARRITLTAEDGHSFDAWSAEPARAPKGGIVVLQAIYGLTDHLGDVCDEFAADGYAAIAPALYDRTERNRVFPYDGTGVVDGTAYREHLKEPTVCLDVAACAAELRKTADRIAVSGFCTGGTWAWISANALDFDAAVIFYGTDVFENLDRTPACPTILHYGDSDHIVPLERINAIGAAHPACELEIYPGCGHAFFNPEQEHYDADAVRLVRQRTLAFLDRVFSATRAS